MSVYRMLADSIDQVFHILIDDLFPYPIIEQDRC